MPKAGKFNHTLRYGLRFQKPKGEKHTEAEWNLRIELLMISHGGKYNGLGEGLPFHVKRAMKMMWPTMEWHRWSDLIVDEFLKSPGRTACFGPSSSGKSFVFSRAALTMFYAKPDGTTVLISSTTRDALTRRIWDYVVSSDKAAREQFDFLPGSLIESKLMLLADESDADGRSFKNGVVGIACKKGGQWQGLEEYVGTKNDVVILVADEAHFMPMGFLDSLANLESNDQCFAAIMGNLPDIHNPLGRAAEPKIGWDALPDTDKTRVYETRWRGGRAIQLIGLDSPNLDFPEGKEPYKKLIGRRYIEQCAENYGRDSDKFNMFASGKIPKACTSRTVFTRAMCYKNNATQPVKWSHEKLTRGYMMDVAYSGVGGDRTPGAPFIFGKDVTGRNRFWIGPIKLFRGSDDPKVSHPDAIAVEVRSECEAHDIPPEHFFFDGTGRSEFTSSCARLWSPSVVPLEFGGKATERESTNGEKWGPENPEKEGQPKLCCDVFDRFVTELWFSIREALLADQIRGMTEEMIDEGSQRRWEIVRGAKYSIEPKVSERRNSENEPVGMKARGLRSPDLCDMLAAGIEGARRLGFPVGKTSVSKAPSPNRGWLDYMREKQWEDLKKEELVA